MTQQTKKRVLMIGLDGYDPELAERLMHEGKLPNLQGLIKRSASFPLDHGIYRYTGLAGEHIASGQSPDLSGRWSAVEFDPDRYVASQPDTSIPPFINSLESRTVIFDAPYFDLARSSRSCGIVGWGAHDPGIQLQSEPPELLEEINQRFGRYEAEKFIYAFTWPSMERTQRAGESLCRGAAQRTNIIEWLLKERLPDWELAYVVWSEFHSIIEPMWHGVDSSHPLHEHATAELSGQMVTRLYQAVDEGIGRLAREFPDASIVMFSMHGMGPNHGDVPSMALLPEFIYRQQTGNTVLHVPDSWRKMPVPMLEAGESWEKYVIASLHHPQASLLDRIRLRLKRIRKHGNRTRSLNWMPANHYQRYWREMKAFALPSFYDGRIRINLKGREKYGKVDPHDYEKVCEQIKADLLKCTNPLTGAQAVGEVVYRPLPAALNANRTESDILVFWRETILGIDHPQFGSIGPLPLRRTGGHTGGHGAAYILDETIQPGNYAVQSSFNVIPTVFHLFGLAKPENISGTSLLQTNPNALKKH